MTDAEKIQIAADMIRTEMAARGSVVSEADSLAVARRLHGIWYDVMTALNDTSPAAIAQRLRQRHEGTANE